MITLGLGVVSVLLFAVFGVLLLVQGITGA